MTSSRPQSPARREFAAGCRAAAPILVGTVPFGFVAGVAAVGADMTPLQGIALSLFAFSGIAQLVVAQLVAAQSPALVTLAAALVVSLRFQLRDHIRRRRPDSALATGPGAHSRVPSGDDGAAGCDRG